MYDELIVLLNDVLPNHGCNSPAAWSHCKRTVVTCGGVCVYPGIGGFC